MAHIPLSLIAPSKENVDANRAGIATKRKSDVLMTDAPSVAAKKKTEVAPKAAPKAPVAKASSAIRGTASTTARARPGAPAPTSVSASAAKKAALAITAPTNNGKRPGWDLKGRLEDMESMHQSMAEQLKTTSSSLSQLMSQLNERNTTVAVLADSKKQLLENLQNQQRDFERAAGDQQRLLENISQMKRDHQNEIDAAATKVRGLELDLEQSRSRIRILTEDVERLKHSLENTQSTLAQTESVLASTKNDLQVSQQKNDEKAKKIEEFLLKINSLEENVKMLENKSREDERVRRKLHNTIQELKGNIRVFCRVRPITNKEREEGFTVPFFFPSNDERSLELTAAPEKNAIGKTAAQGKKWSFSFDKMFQPGASQLEVFQEVSQLVQSSLDGYNTCIFTYGQTGSGKTYTMEGPQDPDHHSKGVIPRAVEQVFSSAKELEEQGWSFEMEASFLEIYNETIQDLLSSTAPVSEHKIIHEGATTTVTGLTTAKVVAPSQVYELLKRAAKNRSTGSTKMNERSSRSHSVFQLRIKGKNSITAEDIKGLLNLIDLAGSERLDQSGATGDRLTETKNINKSLSTLAKVIFALANKESHVPYRDSKLTYLLQNSLGGNSKTLMFVNVSPLDRDLNETLNSLRFATQVNACEIGTAKKQGTKKLIDM